jgi:phosphoribosylglycinamide formyltransferase 1
MIKMVRKIAIFASGSGSNALKIIEYFHENVNVEVALILTNNSKAGVITHAKSNHIPYIVFDRNTYNATLAQSLVNEKIDLIVLAGFLWLVPAVFIRSFPNKIINIHPSLLPKYGGKGMYGSKVHEAVLANHEIETGITIHYVNENFDEGVIIAQYKCDLEISDSMDEITKKVQILEHKYYPIVINKVLFDNK